MLKIRVMPTMLYKDFGLVKGKGFDSWRRTGSLMQAVKVYNMREVDELVFVDIAATLEGREPDYALVDDFADDCFMPLTVGGGVRTIEQVGRLLAVGADKVAINSAAVESPGLIDQIAKRYGAQCCVVSIDFRRPSGAAPEVFSRAGTKPTGLDLAVFARECADRGAGEILLTSIERDGTFEGYDVEAIRSVADAVGIPVVASGGCGEYEHMAAVLSEGGASAVAAASIFHFTEKTPLEAKKRLAEKGFRVRL
ncbi:MAG: imidazole glycerol phosphate synthase cyclase subunit [Elusimicrobia bacterium]|nr:imidazole glycerol phosphate synthase cyclase subunit [Elusimicrobiota bacterium]